MAQIPLMESDLPFTAGCAMAAILENTFYALQLLHFFLSPEVNRQLSAGGAPGKGEREGA